ncbi:hypothetical protein KB1253_09390 [Lactiplantibacillus plantarum]|nr:hypothetical protein KB1253_09390 [Lactiplantibacillus plantarum]VTU55993.1 hypothetical protein AMBR_LLDLPDMO_01746 [Lactiplantibacillus plantarum]
MENLNLKFRSEMLNELAFYTKVLTLFENTESLTEDEIKKRVSFYSRKTQFILNDMTDQSTYDSSSNRI